MVQERNRPRAKRVKIEESSESEADYQSDVEVDDEAESQELISSQLSSLSGGNSKEIDENVLALLQKQLSKKREEKQKKLLSSIEKHLLQENVKTAKEIDEIIHKVNELHTKFLLDYAACEDRIRKKWAKIYKEEEALEKFIRDRKKGEGEKYDVAWEEQVAGLSKMRTAYKAFQDIVKELANECSDISDMRPSAASPLKERV
ncbi:hypothetical protein BJ165DRAFT_1141781 [Panaeolus papilionaceus]|nr:hypothetical protein BJ165DRAFT_1141781 [Panaeolus papilionaceus]